MYIYGKSSNILLFQTFKRIILSHVKVVNLPNKHNQTLYKFVTNNQCFQQGPSFPQDTKIRLLRMYARRHDKVNGLYFTFHFRFETISRFSFYNDIIGHEYKSLHR